MLGSGLGEFPKRMVLRSTTLFGYGLLPTSTLLVGVYEYIWLAIPAVGECMLLENALPLGLWLMETLLEKLLILLLLDSGLIAWALLLF